MSKLLVLDVTAPGRGPVDPDGALAYAVLPFDERIVRFAQLRFDELAKLKYPCMEVHYLLSGEAFQPTYLSRLDDEEWFVEEVSEAIKRDGCAVVEAEGCTGSPVPVEYCAMMLGTRQEIGLAAMPANSEFEVWSRPIPLKKLKQLLKKHDK